MTSDFDTIRANLRSIVDLTAQADYVDVWESAALAALSRVQAASEQTEKALANLVEHIDLNGGCHRGCPEHDDARAALVSADPKEGAA